jgi:hypothetical protein
VPIRTIYAVRYLLRSGADPSRSVQVAETKKGLLTLKAELSVDGQEKGLRLTFPRPCREDGGQVISALRNA